jgi:hypothetical protein
VLSIGVGRTRPIRPTRAAPSRSEPIRADFMHFFAGSDSEFQNPVGSGRLSGLLNFFGRVPDPPRLYPLIYTYKKKNPRTTCNSRSLHHSRSLPHWPHPLPTGFSLSLTSRLENSSLSLTSRLGSRPSPPWAGTTSRISKGCRRFSYG